LLPFLGLPGGIWKAAIDAAVLVTLSAPFLYVWVARGMAERLSEKYIQGFLENARDLVQSVTPEGRFLYVNGQ
jgi:PAS domain-containing protein